MQRAGLESLFRLLQEAKKASSNGTPPPSDQFDLPFFPFLYAANFFRIKIPQTETPLPT